MRSLAHILRDAAAAHPARIAVESASGGVAWTYAQLAARAHAVSDALRAAGVRPGDRVGVAMRKTPRSLAAVLGVLEAGCAYVPVDADGPVDRAATILSDSAVCALFVDALGAEALCEALACDVVAAGALDDVPSEEGLATRLLVARTRDARSTPELAYILSTSGSTGRPKGVMITHANALAFVDWCAATFDTGPGDRFSSHAPFHFDLSILDIYLALRSGGTLVLIDEETGRQPRRLAPFVAERRLTVWYSTPSILSLLVQHGRLERHDCPALRYVLFAGEVFPARHLRSLTRIWRGPRFFNLYGPTETNVCTFFEVPADVPDARSEPYPIGRACAHVATRVLDDAREVTPGDEGELVVHGAPVTPGYWQLPERTAQAFVTDADGRRWYRTGDIVRETPDGYVYVGRRDRMVKRRGHRVELGEIEARLYRHPDVVEAAVTARPDPEQGVRVRAFLCWREGRRPSLVALKAYLAEHLPASMVPDEFVHLDALPKTSTDKIDYERLRSGP